MKTLKLEALYWLLGWFLKFYDPHHDAKLREKIDFTRGQVYQFIRDPWRMKLRKQSWNYCGLGSHEPGCHHNEPK